MGYLLFLLPLLCLAWSWVLGALMLLRKPVCLTGTTAAWIWALSWGLSWVPVALVPELLNWPGIEDNQEAVRIAVVVISGLVGVAGVYCLRGDLLLVNGSSSGAFRAVCAVLEARGLKYRGEAPRIWVQTPEGERRILVRPGGSMPAVSVDLPSGLGQGLERDILRASETLDPTVARVRFPYFGCLMLVIVSVVLLGLIMLLLLPIT